MNIPLLTDRELLVAASGVGAEQRALDVRRAAIAGELASRPDMIQLAGHARPSLMVAELWGISSAEAHRLVEVGLATRTRVAIDGSSLPARFELIRDALPDMGIEKAAIAVRELTRAKCSHEAREQGERALVERAAGFIVPDFAELARQVRNRLDQDGPMPRDRRHHLDRTLKFVALPDGMTRVVWEMTPVTAGLVRAGIDAIVSSELRRGRDEGVEEERSFEQLRADAAEQIFRHAATCEHAGGDLPSITMVIRMSREELLTGAGFATIDGVDESISATTARHLAADAEFIPMVLDGHGMPLDYGHPRRLFSRAQKLAYIARDDGCAWAGCSSPPAYGEAHHIQWWSHGGPTDLANGTSYKYDLTSRNRPGPQSLGRLAARRISKTRYFRLAAQPREKLVACNIEPLEIHRTHVVRESLDCTLSLSERSNESDASALRCSSLCRLKGEPGSFRHRVDERQGTLISLIISLFLGLRCAL